MLRACLQLCSHVCSKLAFLIGYVDGNNSTHFWNIIVGTYLSHPIEIIFFFFFGSIITKLGVSEVQVRIRGIGCFK